MTVQKNVFDYQLLAPVFALVFVLSLFTLTGVVTIICGITGLIALKYISFSEGYIFGIVSIKNTCNYVSVI